ncbi:MAG: dihydrofolate synthase/folylpolyglutamate synthase [Candidatus Latescibacterota bacterium]|jgi:dihydrofolate synthase/folylpolyglutamate synthase
MYQRVGKAAYKADLDNTLKLASYLDNPERAFKSVHVAGTNGKGSSSHMMASVLQEAGYKVGLYTSPHLIDFRERIRINGDMIPKRTVAAFIIKHKGFFEANHMSFFEMTVGLAFDYFRSEKVDIAIVEVGLGGRLDSTNIMLPEVSVITNIGLDHTQFLGNSLAEIAVEKAGIIKQNVPVVIGETVKETKTVFLKISEAKNAPIRFAAVAAVTQYATDLKGVYQIINQRTVLVALEELKKKGWNILDKHIAKGLMQVEKSTGLMGRWQVLQETPKVICDTAHNKEGLQSVMPQLMKESFEKLHIVLGMVSDKNLDNVLPLFPKNAQYYFCKPNIPRGMEAELLKTSADKYNLKGGVYESVSLAFRTAKKDASKRDLIYVGGSTFVVAEIL